jgi:hypothetical protein
MGLGWIGPVALAVAVRPRLWATALHLVPPGWWRRVPPRPWPPSDYIRFRLQTMYGDRPGGPHPEDVVDYLEWCRRMGRRTR